MAILVFAVAVHAETFPITATARFETGIRRLATVTMSRPQGATVDWGDGTVQPGLLVCPVVGNQCDILGTHRYTAAGSYLIKIAYRTPFFLVLQEETTTATISPVGDFVILSIGDSVASGEGSPIVDIGVAQSVPFAYWDDPGSNYDYPPGHADAPSCHRSRKSGPAQAATQVAITNSVTFIHVACSGHDVANAISQLRSARGRLPRIDVLLISAGANNIGGGFGNLITTCLVNSPVTPCSEDDDFAAMLASDIARLETQYKNLGEVINCIRPEDGEPDNCSSENQIPKLVLITEYFDPTGDRNGEFPSGPTNVACMGAAISATEWEFLYHNVLLPLNSQVRASPWNAVAGIQGIFRNHGYCAFDERWVLTITDSLGLNGDQNGTGHPNLTGQGVYKNFIYSNLINLNPPVTTATATANNSPYAFSTFTQHDVEVTLSAKNPIRESGVGNTYYSVDNADCQPATPGNCQIYQGPFMITTSGKHVVRFFSNNAFNGRERLQTAEVWIDKDPPVLTCTATPSELWAPSHSYVTVTTSVQAIDAMIGPRPFVLASVDTSEGDASTDIVGFMIGEPDTSGELKASRLGMGDGRVYSLTYQASDEVGNTGSCVLEIMVPHDQRDNEHRPAEAGNDRPPETPGNPGGNSENHSNGGGNSESPGVPSDAHGQASSHGASTTQGNAGGNSAEHSPEDSNAGGNPQDTGKPQ